jgi:hypothetical protein
LDARPWQRRVLLHRRSDHVVEASIEDFIHHFRLELEHDLGAVTEVRGEAVRAPWSVCPGATTQLRELVGTPLDRTPRPLDPTEHCTHLLDLAAVAVRFAAASVPSRRIDLEVVGWDGPDARATATRDDGLRLEWTVRDWTVVDPPPYAGRSLGAGFGSWAASSLDGDEAELALLLRRATLMSPSRGIDLDDFDRISESRVIRGSCFASKPERIEVGRRNRGSSLPHLP